MKPYNPSGFILLLSFLCLLFKSSYAQSDNVNLTIKAVKVLGTYNANRETEDYRFRISYNGTEVSGACLGVNNINSNTEIATNYTVVSSKPVRLNDAIKLEVEAWEEDGCSDCLYTAGGRCGDNAHCGKGVGIISGTSSQSEFTLRDFGLKPGSVAPSENIVAISYCGGSYRVWYQITYNMPTPARPTVNIINAANASPCDVKREVELSTTTSLSTAFNSQIRYHWSYTRPYKYQSCIPNPEACINECTAPPDPNWTQPICCIFDPEFCTEICSAPPDPNWVAPECCSLPACIGYEEVYGTYFSAIPDGITQANINSGKLTIDIRSLPGFENLTQSMQISFRVFAVANGSASGFPAASITVRIDPLPPTVSEPILTEASCIEKGTGKIVLSNISGVLGIENDPDSRYGYVLRKGSDATPCTPDSNGSPGNCMQVGSESGSFTGTTHTIGLNDSKQILAGTYTLLLTNPGGSYGVCYKPYTITVAGIPELSTDEVINTISCNGSSNGSIEVSIRDGDPSLVTYNLTKSGFSQDKTSTVPNAKVAFTNLSAGLYALKVNDGNCSSEVNVSLSITQPKKVFESSFEPSSPFATCMDPGNGSIRVQVGETSESQDVNVSNNYSFVLNKKDDSNNWFLYTSSDQVSPLWEFNKSLPVGEYELQVKETGGESCNAYIKSFSVAPPSPLLIDLNATRNAITNETCDYTNNGSLIVAGASGGSSLFDFELRCIIDNVVIPDHVMENGKFENLQSGYYELTLKNALSGCNDKVIFNNTSDLFFVNEPPPLNITLNPSSITCYPLDDGNISSIVTGGTKRTAPEVEYSYSWYQELSTGNWAQMGAKQDQPIITNLIEGDYRLVVKDQHQCTATSNVVSIIRPAELSIDSVGVKDIACFGEKGNIVIKASGGTAPLGYEYAPVASTSFAGFTATTPLDAGVYKVQVKDVNNCLATDEFNTYTLTAPLAPLTFSAEKSDYNGFNISCFNGSNGSVKLTPTGGNGNTYSGYTFRIDAQDFSLQDSIYSINAGDHLLAVQDGRGCIVTQTIHFTQAPQLQTTTWYKKDVDCHGAATGVIELNVVGGAGTFNYQQGTLTAQASPRFENLAANAYVFTIIDENECQSTYTDTIVNLHAPITSTAVINDALCYQSNDGLITLSVTGGSSATYAYQLAGVGVVSNPVQNLTAGTYAMQVTDSKGCLHAIENLVVGEPDPLTIDSVGYKDIVCLGDSGTIDVFASGGTTPYDYQYVTNNEGTYSSFTNTTALSAATYTVRVVDSHQCVSTHATPVFITDPPAALDFSYQLSDYNGFNISCYGGDNGFVIVNASGGNGSSYTGYQFAVDDRPFQTASRIDRINYGLHTISTVDGRGCVVTRNVTLTQSSDELSGVLSFKEDVRCFYEATGKLEVSASGGIGDYTYWISPSNKQTTPRFSSLPVGDYRITIADKNNCETTVNSSIASIHPMFSLAFDVNDVNCYDGQDGSISLTVSGGVSPFQYAWTNHSSTTSQLENRRAGTYEVKVTDDAGCFVTERATIVQPAAPLVISSVESKAACYDQANGSVVMSAQGGTQPYQYSIDNGASYFSTNIINSPVGTASIVVQDSQGCVATATTTVTQRNNRPEPNFLVSSKQNALDTLVITDISVPKPDSIHWTFDATAQILNANPWMPEIKFAGAGSYPILMTSYFGDCAYVVTKNVQLSPFDPDRAEEALPGVSPIQSMTVTPNPTSGEFTVSVTLNKKRNLSLLVFDIVGNILYQKNYEEVSSVEQYINLTTPSSGLYMVRAITEPDAKDVRIVINK